MPLLSSSVLADARTQLNDPNARIYTDDALMPHLIRAYQKLKDELEINGVPIANQVSSIITVPVNTLVISDSTLPALPSDLIQPIQLRERRAGNTNDLFVEMVQKPWEPEDIQVDQLRYWVWRDEELHFLGATAAVEVKIRYLRDIPDLVDVNSPILIRKSKLFLAAKTAEYGARFIGQNQTKATLLQADANEAKAKLIRRAIRLKQGMPARRRRYWQHRRRISWPSR